MQENSSIPRLVAKHEEDLYRGDPPGTGITTRLARLEFEVEKLTKNTNRLVFAVLGAVLLVVAQIFIKALHL